MRHRYTITFSDKQWEALKEFQYQLASPGHPPLTVQELVKRCVFYAINDSVRRAQQLQAEALRVREAANDSSREYIGNPPEVPPGTDADSTALADQEVPAAST